MKKDYSYEQRREMANKLNECGFAARINGVNKLAHLSGLKLEYPVVITQDKETHFEITWQIAEALANNELKYVQF